MSGSRLTLATGPVLVLLLAGCGGSGAAGAAGGAGGAGGDGTLSRTVASSTASAQTPPAQTAAASLVHTAPRARSRQHRHELAAWRRALPHPDAGRLPQTTAIPSSHTTTFAAEMRVLWDGIRTGSARPAMAAFFPEAAYAQLKAIGDPQYDWQARLVGDYALDIAAAHAQIGIGARTARLIAVEVPAAQIKYVPAQICENRFGYEEVPNSRIVYRSGGVLRSIGIASLISWRGLWYVVHLGAVVRSGDTGIVDDPSDGAGISAPSTTC